MAKLLFRLWLCLFALHSFAGNIICTNADFTGNPQSLRVVYVFYLDAPTSTYTNIITRDRLRYTNDSTGYFIITNYYPGNYRFEFNGTFTVTTNWFTFPATNGTVNAADPQWGSGPTNGIVLALTRAAGDTRYVAKTNGIADNLRLTGGALRLSDAADDWWVNWEAPQNYLIISNRGDFGYLKISSDGVVEASSQFAGTFVGNGSALTALNASQLTSGTVPLARLPDLSGNYVARTNGVHSGVLTLQGTNGDGAVIDIVMPANGNHRGVYYSTAPGLHDIGRWEVWMDHDGAASAANSEFSITLFGSIAWGVHNRFQLGAGDDIGDSGTYGYCSDFYTHGVAGDSADRPYGYARPYIADFVGFVNGGAQYRNIHMWGHYLNTNVLTESYEGIIGMNMLEDGKHAAVSNSTPYIRLMGGAGGVAILTTNLSAYGLTEVTNLTSGGGTTYANWDASLGTIALPLGFRSRGETYFGAPGRTEMLVSKNNHAVILGQDNNSGTYLDMRDTSGAHYFIVDPGAGGYGGNWIGGTFSVSKEEAVTNATFEVNGTAQATKFYIGSTTGPIFWTGGSGSPESSVTARIGSLYSRTDGDATTALYVKGSGTGNTGWGALSTSASTGIATNSGTGTNNVFTSPTIINLGLVRQDSSHGVIPIRFDPSGAFVEIGTNNTYSGSVAGMVTVFGVSNSIANTAAESFILGYSNVINGGASHSVAMGSYGTINNNHSGTFLFSDLSSTSQFVSPAANTFNIRATGGVNIQAGTSAGSARAGGDLKVSTTTTGNVGGGEDNLITYSVPASTLSANGQYIEYDCWGYFTNNANAKDLKIYFGSTAIFDSTALVLNGVAWRGHGKVVRTGAATQTATCEFTIGGTLLGAVTTTTTQLSSPAETLSGAVTFKVTGTDSGVSPVDNSIVQVAQVIKWGQGQ